MATLYEIDKDFNPRSPCGERLGSNYYTTCLKEFQSTLPVRGATCPRGVRRCPRRISIHAPRAGSDLTCWIIIRWWTHFNPRSPCGERRQISDGVSVVEIISIHAPRAGSDERYMVSTNGDIKKFQSTLPVRGATGGGGEITSEDINFNPRSPCGERPTEINRDDFTQLFQSTLPVRGATPLSRL